MIRTISKNLKLQRELIGRDWRRLYNLKLEYLRHHFMIYFSQPSTPITQFTQLFWIVVQRNLQNKKSISSLLLLSSTPFYIAYLLSLPHSQPHLSRLYSDLNSTTMKLLCSFCFPLLVQFPLSQYLWASGFFINSMFQISDILFGMLIWEK